MAVATKKAAWADILPSTAPSLPVKPQMVSAIDILEKVKRLIISSQISDATNILDNLIADEGVDELSIDVGPWPDACKPTPASGRSAVTENEAKPVKKAGWGSLLGWRHLRPAHGRRVKPQDFSSTPPAGTGGCSEQCLSPHKTPFSVDSDTTQDAIWFAKNIKNANVKFNRMWPEQSTDAPQDIDVLSDNASTEVDDPGRGGFNVFEVVRSLPDPTVH
eukprot:TRINITY_DN23991_c0_g1_i2.p1 TRINITY_DN23991_c0_g1~~TRINITY_DN23991_c0_g1_i2.p1  ORF type:complete len:219 (-),score=39.96 TRINITY_DN23991_c0_g1_i2:312-968(-)